MYASFSILAGIGVWWGRILYRSGVVWAVLAAGVQPSTWTRSRRQALAVQIDRIGVSAVPIVAVLASVISVTAAIQSFQWLKRVGATDFFGDLYVFLLINVLTPALVAFLVLARSGTAIVSELSVWNRPQPGHDLLLDTVLPRVWGLTISLICLSVLFVMFSIISGCLFGTLGSDAQMDEYSDFLNPVFRSLDGVNMVIFMAEVTLLGLICGAICCCEGLDLGRGEQYTLQASGRAVLAGMVIVVFFTTVIILLGFSPDTSNNWAEQRLEGVL